MASSPDTFIVTLTQFQFQNNFSLCYLHNISFSLHGLRNVYWFVTSKPFLGSTKQGLVDPFS